MEQLAATLDKLFAKQPVLLRFSSPYKEADVRRAVLAKKDGGRWQLESFTETQAFHKNFDEAGAKAEAQRLLAEQFGQASALGEGLFQQLRITKKGRVLYQSRPATPQEQAGLVKQSDAGHDRQKKALLLEGEVIPPLVDMGVFTQDGRVAHGMYDKYRQINRFVELLDDTFRKSGKKRLRVLDFGCGKSYLTFIVYHYITKILGAEADITGLDLKQKGVENCNAAAQKYGYAGLKFLAGDVADYVSDEPIDLMMTLHACDTATDYALAAGVKLEAGAIFSVPCCQHELNGQIESEAFALLTRYGLVKERVAALMTDAIRANLLTACGYKTQLVEFVELEHTPKNILIRATKAGLPKAERQKALAEVERLCDAFHLRPTLLQLLRANGHIE